MSHKARKRTFKNMSYQNFHWGILDSQGCNVSSCGQKKNWPNCEYAQADLSRSRLLLVPREGCASGLWYFLVIFIYTFVGRTYQKVRFSMSRIIFWLQSTFISSNTDGSFTMAHSNSFFFFFFFFFEFPGNSIDSPRKQVVKEFLGKFSYFFSTKLCVVCTY